MKKKTKKDFEELTNFKYSIEGELKNFSTKTLIKCHTCGHTWMAKPETLTRKEKPVTCPRCPIEIKIQSVKKEKGIYTNSQYKTCHDECIWNCMKCGHTWSTKISNIIYNNTGCVKCLNSSKRKTDQSFKEELYNLVGDEYTVLDTYFNADTPLRFKHNLCGTEYLSTPNNFLGTKNRHGRRCPECSHGSILKTNDKYSSDLERYRPGEFELVGDYLGNKKYVTLLCKNCNKKFEAFPNNILYLNSACPHCTTLSSRPQKELFDFISSLYTDNLNVKNNFTLNSKKQIDVFVKSENIGFELDGLYWHSEGVGGKTNIYEKTQLGLSENIRIVHIYEDEWNNKKEIIKSKIKAILKLKENQEKIYARNCKVQEISTKTKNIFLEENHIQGQDNSNIKLGLFYNNDLVSVMTFVKPRLGFGQTKEEGTIELSRFSTKINKNIIGRIWKTLKIF